MIRDANKKYWYEENDMQMKVSALFQDIKTSGPVKQSIKQKLGRDRPKTAQRVRIALYSTLFLTNMGLSKSA